MATPSDGLLERYLNAATHLAATPQKVTIDNANTTQTQTTISVPSPSSSSSASPCPQATAAQALLRRQAAVLVRLHKSTLTTAQRHQNRQDDAASDAVDANLLRTRLDDLATICMSRFYAYRFDQLPTHWRQMYSDTLILTAHHRLLVLGGGKLSDAALDEVVTLLDRALIVAGGAGEVLGAAWIEKTMAMLENAETWQVNSRGNVHEHGSGDAHRRPTKRRRRSPSPSSSSPSPSPSPSSSSSSAPEARYARRFRTDEPHGRPRLSPARSCPRHRGWTLPQFEDYMMSHGPRGSPPPVVFTDLMAEWPALRRRPWSSPSYLLSRTFGGRRLVPVEIGRSYVDEGWGQALLPFREFLDVYVDPSLQLGHKYGGKGGDSTPDNNNNNNNNNSNNNNSSSSSSSGKEDQVAEHEDGGSLPAATATATTTATTGYLAQHSLFHQVPSLRNDIYVPDFCWATVPSHPLGTAHDQPPVDVPRLNAWFGPARTITPLHTDGFHNLLCQVVGTKYVRLYAPRDTPRMCPRPPDAGVDMSNTSALDVGLLEGWDAHADGREDKEDEVDKMRRAVEGVPYWECVLAPGDALVIPMGWWHYVRSLSVSFSVSFWWN